MSTDTKLLAAQARIKVLREALADLHYTVYRDDATGDSAGDALRETDDTAELDALIADAKRWRSHIAAMHALMKPGHGSHEANCERKEKP